MPIKLSDVIENVNSNFAVVETNKHNIVGLYNGSVGTAPSLEIYHNGTHVKTGLTSDGVNTNRVEVYKSPFAQSAGTNLVTGTDSLKLETRKGGLISVHDGVLNDGNGGEAVYLVQQDPTAGNVSDTFRSDITRFTELIQDFDMYQSVTGAAAVASSGDFFLAGYDTALKKTRKLTIGSLLDAFTTEVADDTSPELGGNLDLKTFGFITSSSDQDIAITPSGTGKIKLNGTVDLEQAHFKAQTATPTAIAGGMYRDNNDNLYFGVS